MMEFLIQSCKDQQNIYYFFSSAAQSIAAFVAFILAGYALVHQMMDNEQSRDDSLQEINHAIKVHYHSAVKKLSFATGFTILYCLLIIWLNGYLLSMSLFLIGGMLSIAITMIWSLCFVVDMIDPNKRESTARQLLQTTESNAPNSSLNERKTGNISLGEFVTQFISLERMLRSYISSSLHDTNDFISNNNRPPSFTAIVEGLMRREIIDTELYILLKELSRYRNLVVHGNIDNIDPNMYEKVEQAMEKVSILNSVPRDNESNRIE